MPSRSTEACSGAPGRGSRLWSSDDSEGIDREGRVLPYEPVHGGLERAACAARRRVPLTRRRGRSRVILCARARQNPGRARRGWGRSIVSIVRSCVSTYSTSSGASITDGIPYSLSQNASHRVWGLPLAEQASTKALRAASREGQSSNIILIYNMRRDIQKEKLIVFIIGRNKPTTTNIPWGKTQPSAGDGASAACLHLVPPRRLGAKNAGLPVNSSISCMSCSPLGILCHPMFCSTHGHGNRSTGHSRSASLLCVRQEPWMHRHGRFLAVTEVEYNVTFKKY